MTEIGRSTWRFPREFWIGNLIELFELAASGTLLSRSQNSGGHASRSSGNGLRARPLHLVRLFRDRRRRVFRSFDLPPGDGSIGPQKHCVSRFGM